MKSVSISRECQIVFVRTALHRRSEFSVYLEYSIYS